MAEWTHQTGDEYALTGTDRNGRRYSFTTPNPHHALGINQNNGSLWLKRNGRRILLRRIKEA